jgi:hypothetical protein
MTPRYVASRLVNSMLHSAESVLKILSNRLCAMLGAMLNSAESTPCRVSSFACFFSFAQHETKRNKSSVSRNFACFAINIFHKISLCFVSSQVKFRFVSQNFI